MFYTCLSVILFTGVVSKHTPKGKLRDLAGGVSRPNLGGVCPGVSAQRGVCWGVFEQTDVTQTLRILLECIVVQDVFDNNKFS